MWRCPAPRLLLVLRLEVVRLMIGRVRRGCCGGLVQPWILNRLYSLLHVTVIWDIPSDRSHTAIWLECHETSIAAL